MLSPVRGPNVNVRKWPRTASHPRANPFVVPSDRSARTLIVDLPFAEKTNNVMIGANVVNRGMAGKMLTTTVPPRTYELELANQNRCESEKVPCGAQIEHPKTDAPRNFRVDCRIS